MRLQSNMMCRRLHLCRVRFGIWDVGIEYKTDDGSFRHQLAHQFDALWPQLTSNEGRPVEIPAWPVKAGDKTQGDWITRGDKYDGDRRGRAFRHQDRNVTTDSEKHIDPTSYQIQCKRRNSLEMSVGPTVFDNNVFAVYKTCRR